MSDPSEHAAPLTAFRAALSAPGLVDRLRTGMIGEGATIPGPRGPVPLLYADHVASGRAVRLVEDFVAERILPYYANSHTEASWCGAYITTLREAARAEIARIAGCPDDSRVIFAGAGATAGLNRLVSILEIPRRIAAGQKVVVLVGPYEHHSNLLPWRESGAEVIEMAEAAAGGPDLDHLRSALRDHAGADLRIGAFSAMSNVTGIATDTVAVTRLLKSAGALAIWDFAGAGPYLPMEMAPAPDAVKDAIVFSAHKFPGGPGASGVLILREGMAARRTPSQPGGGTVRFVSSWGHVWSDSLVRREEAGTPNVVGDIRAGLVLMIKEAIGQGWITARNRALRDCALRVWSRNPVIEILGNAAARPAVPLFAMRLRDGRGGYLCYDLVTRMLSDLAGVQARGGCACAGPYGHRLLGIDRDRSLSMQQALESGARVAKPGWVRLNLSYSLDDAKADMMIDAVDRLCGEAAELSRNYRRDNALGVWEWRGICADDVPGAVPVTRTA